MARRPTKRTDLLPDLAGSNADPGDDPSFLDLKLEIAIRKGLGDDPFPPVVRSQLANLLGIEISDKTWQAVKAATARYMLRAFRYRAGVTSSQMRTACEDIVRAIDKLKEAHDRNAIHPNIRAFLNDSGLGDSIRHLAGFERGLLLREIEKCSDIKHVAMSAGWDKWVRDLARIAPEMGIAPSGEGPDRHKGGGSSAFVVLLRQLQAALPEDFEEHESYSGSSEASFARAIRRALNAG